MKTLKKIAFVSDFDGTLTKKDFYHIIIDKYLGQKGRDFYNQWRETKKINTEFLNIIFGSIDLTEDELKNDILQIPLDDGALEFIKEAKVNNFDLYILSAGTSYYIKILFEYLSISHIPIISMEGRYENGGIKILPDKNSPYYSDVFGIDKSKVIRELKEKYDKVFFAGDSEPDLTAALASDLAFGKSQLSILLNEKEQKFIDVLSYQQILEYMNGKRWFK